MVPVCLYTDGQVLPAQAPPEYAPACPALARWGAVGLDGGCVLERAQKVWHSQSTVNQPHVNMLPDIVVLLADRLFDPRESLLQVRRASHQVSHNVTRT